MRSRQTFMLATLVLLSCNRVPTQVSHSHIVRGQVPPADQADARNLSTVSITSRSLLAETDPEMRSFCSGTLIGPRLVLTAAHCLVGGLPPDLGVAWGSPAPVISSFIGAQRIKIHERYDDENINNDIALIYLNQDAPLPYQPALLPDRPLRVQQELWIAGYGNNDGRRGTGNGTLRQAQVEVSDLGWDEATPRFSIEGRRGESTCMGDSGGPSYSQESDGIFRVVGITSYGLTDDCSDGWNTDVHAFVSWIEAHAEVSVVDTGVATDPQPGEVDLSFRNLGEGQVEFQIEAPGADEVLLFVDRLDRPFLERQLVDGQTSFSYTFLSRGARTMRVIAYRQQRKVAERSFPFRVL